MPSSQDMRGSTCLHLAARRGHTGVLQYLVSMPSIDVNCKVTMCMSLFYRIYIFVYMPYLFTLKLCFEFLRMLWGVFDRKTDAVWILECLIIEDYGSSSFGQDDGGWAPLTWATENTNLEQVKMLISAGADVQIRDKVCEYFISIFQLFFIRFSHLVC